METARLAERIVQLQEVAKEIREIVPTASIDTPDRSGRGLCCSKRTRRSRGSFIESLSTAGPDSAVFNGMGGGELTPEELQIWLQGNLDNFTPSSTSIATFSLNSRARPRSMNTTASHA